MQKKSSLQCRLDYLVFAALSVRIGSSPASPQLGHSLQRKYVYIVFELLVVLKEYRVL